MSAILETENLRKYFKTPKGYLHAVEDVSISINRGETLGVVGESGCGKSTLGRTILHLLEPTGGKICFEGQDITGAKGAQLKALRKKMQIIFQDPFSSLNPRMTVGQIIGEPLKIYKLTKSKEEYNARVYELMDMVGLARRNLNSYPHEFDGGRRQRIGRSSASAAASSAPRPDSSRACASPTATTRASSSSYRAWSPWNLPSTSSSCGS